MQTGGGGVKLLCEGTDEDVLDAVMDEFDFSSISEDIASSVKNNLALVEEVWKFNLQKIQ